MPTSDLTRLRRHTSRAASAGLVLLLAAGCTTAGSTGTTAAGADRPDTLPAGRATDPQLPDDACAGKKLGLANISTTIPFLASLGDAFTAEAERLGMTATILNANLDNAALGNNMQNLIAQRVDVLAVISSSPTAPVGAARQAQSANIPLIAVNAPLDAAAGAFTYIGASDYDYGVSLGELLKKALPTGGKVAVVMGPLGGTPQVQRLKGLEDGIKDHPGIEIIAKPVDEFDNSKNLAVTQDLLSKYPKGQLDAVVAQGPQMYVGANYAAQNGRNEIKFIAGDYSQQVEDAIRAGALYGTVNQSPRVQGKLGAAYACARLLGQDDKIPAPEARTDLPVITRDNVAENTAEWSG